MSRPKSMPKSRRCFCPKRRPSIHVGSCFRMSLPDGSACIGAGPEDEGPDSVDDGWSDGEDGADSAKSADERPATAKRTTANWLRERTIKRKPPSAMT